MLFFQFRYKVLKKIKLTIEVTKEIDIKEDFFFLWTIFDVFSFHCWMKPIFKKQDNKSDQIYS